MKAKYLIAVVTSLISCNLFAQTTIDNLARTLTDLNPQLKAKRLDANSSIATARLENSLDDPEVEFEHQWGDKQVGNKMNLSVTQSFDWPGVYSARSKANQYQSQALDYLIRSEYIDKCLEIKSAIIDYCYYRELLKYEQESKRLVDSIYSLTLDGYRHGEYSLLTVKRAQLEGIDANRSYVAALNNLESARSVLLLAAGIEESDALAQTLIQKIDELDFGAKSPLRSYDVYLAEATESNPLLKNNELGLLARQWQIKAAKRSAYPGFTLGYSYEDEMGDRFHGLIVGLKLPFFSAHNKSKVAKLSAEAAELDNSLAVSNMRANLMADYRKAVNLVAEISEYESILTGESYIDLIEKALQGGQINVVEYLTELNYARNVYRAYYDMVCEYSLVVARLDKYKQ